MKLVIALALSCVSFTAFAQDMEVGEVANETEVVTGCCDAENAAPSNETTVERDGGCGCGTGKGKGTGE